MMFMQPLDGSTDAQDVFTANDARIIWVEDQREQMAMAHDWWTRFYGDPKEDIYTLLDGEPIDADRP